MRTLCYLLLTALLVACATPETLAIGRSDPAVVVMGTPTPGLAFPAGTSGAREETDVSQNKSSIPIIFRVVEGGGLLGARPGTDLDLLTLYQDGLVVWTEAGIPTSGFTKQVWTGHLSQGQINELMALTDQVGFWTLADSYQPPAVTKVLSNTIVLGPGSMLDQPSSSITVLRGDQRKHVTVYPAGWEEAPTAYRTLRQKLLTTRPSDAAPFTPSTFHLQANQVESTAAQPAQVISWPFDDIQLSHALQMPLVLAGKQGVGVAQFLTTQGLHVSQGGREYILSLFADPPRVP
jgi:hypothetical protein